MTSNPTPQDRKLFCSEPCPAGKCRACDLEVKKASFNNPLDRGLTKLAGPDLRGGDVDGQEEDDTSPPFKPSPKNLEGPRRFGANFTPPTDTGLLVFMNYLPEGETGSEMCANCGKPISRHYGGTQYRCFAVPEGHPDFKGDQASLGGYIAASRVVDAVPAVINRDPIVVRTDALPGYELLAAILDEALEQAQAGKGKERHANDDPFHEQPIVHLNLNLGSSDGALFQAQKKLIESKRLPPARRRAERLGAINYIAASILVDDDLDEQAERKKERG